MAAIQIGQRRNSGESFTRGIAAVGQAIGGIKAIQAGAAQEARDVETHEANIKGKGISNTAAQLELDQKREAIEIKGYQDEFDQGNLIAKEQGVQYKPSFKEFTPKQARAFSDWQVGQMGEDVKLTEASMKLHKMQAAEQYEGIQKEWQGAVSAMAGEVKDPTTALGHLEAGYELHNDGADLVFNKDQKGYKVTMADGSKREFKFDSTDDMFEDFGNKMAPLQGEKGQDNYFKQYIKDQNDRQKRNANGILKSEYWTNDKGEEAQTATLEDNTGKPSLKVRVWDAEGNDMGFISPEAFQAGKFKNVAQQKGEADIGKVKADTAKAKRPSAEERKGWSPEKKLAVDIAEVFNVSEDIAMDRVLNNKALKDKINAITALIEKKGIEHEKTQAAIKGLGLERMFKGELSETPGQGLRRTQQSRTEAATSAKKEAVKTGKGVSTAKKSDFSKTELKDMEADKQRLLKEGKKPAEIAQILRNKYSK